MPLAPACWAPLPASCYDYAAHLARPSFPTRRSSDLIAEAGANPISQLAFTLANGFTIVEYYLARGMKIDDFAPNLDRKSTRLNSSHEWSSYAVFCLKKKSDTLSVRRTHDK